MSTASFDNIQPSAGGTARNAVRGIAAAWANLSGTGTIALRDSENVSSVVDNGTGDYSFNFSNNMANANYSVTVTHNRINGTVNSGLNGYRNLLVSSWRINTLDTSALEDAFSVSSNILGDLA